MSIVHKEVSIHLHSFGVRLAGGPNSNCHFSLDAIYKTVIWSAAVRYLIYLERESLFWAKRKLSPISVFPRQINQILGKQLTKQLFYYSRPECRLILLVIRDYYFES